MPKGKQEKSPNCLTVHIGKYTKMHFAGMGLAEVQLTINKFTEYEQNGVFTETSIFDYDQLELITMVNKMVLVPIDQAATQKLGGNHKVRQTGKFIFYCQPNELRVEDFRPFIR